MRTTGSQGDLAAEETRPPWRTALASAIRLALPTLASRSKGDWNAGSCQVVPGEADADPVQDLHLNWRMSESLRVAGRSASGGVFHGHATVQGARVDFRGDYGRDSRTGALLRFSVAFVGGPRSG